MKGAVRNQTIIFIYAAIRERKPNKLSVPGQFHSLKQNVSNGIK